MDETIKELALIDGAFIVENGVVESAGCLIQAKADEIELPGGMGTYTPLGPRSPRRWIPSAPSRYPVPGRLPISGKGRMFTLFDKSVVPRDSNMSEPSSSSTP